MSQAPSWHRSNLRKLFAKILPGDPEFDALCCDYFPEVKRLFSAGMDRLAKETLMLERIEVPEIIAALSNFSPEGFFRWGHLVEPTGSALPSIMPSSVFAAPTRHPPRTLPEGSFDHDVFLHSAQNRADQRWRSQMLRPALQQRGLSVLDETDFHLGLPYILAMEQAVQRCRYTVLVLSAAYAEEGFAELGGLIAQHLTTEEQSYRVITVLREPCTPRIGIRVGLCVDLSTEATVQPGLDRLAASLKRRPCQSA